MLSKGLTVIQVKKTQRREYCFDDARRRTDGNIQETAKSLGEERKATKESCPSDGEAE
jgi:hypothetical protein